MKYLTEESRRGTRDGSRGVLVLMHALRPPAPCCSLSSLAILGGSTMILGAGTALEGFIAYGTGPVSLSCGQMRAIDSGSF